MTGSTCTHRSGTPLRSRHITTSRCFTVFTSVTAEVRAAQVEMIPRMTLIWSKASPTLQIGIDHCMWALEHKAELHVMNCERSQRQLAVIVP